MKLSKAMLRLRLLAFFLLPAGAVNVLANDAPPILWARFLDGGPSGIYYPKLRADRSGGFFVYSAGGRPLAKFGPNKELEWKIDFVRGEADISETQQLDLLENGDLIGLFQMSGSLSTVRLFGQTFPKAPQFIVQFHPDGSPVSISPIVNCTVTALAAAPGGFVLAGYGSGAAGIGSTTIALGNGSWFLTRFNPAVAWTFLGQGNARLGSDFIAGITMLRQTDALLLDVSTASANWTFGGKDFVGAGRRLLKLPMNATPAPEIFLESAGNVRSISASDGRVALSTLTSIQNFDESGGLLWQSDAIAGANAVAPSGGVFTIGTDSARQCWFAASLDANGTFEWAMSQPSRVNSSGEAIAVLSSGQMVIAGYAAASGIFVGDFFAGDFDALEVSLDGIYLAAFDPRDEAAPAFRAQPKSQRFGIVGEHIELVTDVFSSAGVSLQWFKNGSPLDGQDQPTLDIAAAQASDAGSYWVEASNAFGTTRSATAQLVINSVSVSTLAGTGDADLVNDADPKLAKFNSPRGVIALPNGAILVADTANHVIRKIDVRGVSTFAGSGVSGNAGGSPPSATFIAPASLIAQFHPSTDAEIFVVDTGSHSVRGIPFVLETATASSVTEHEITLPFRDALNIASSEGLHYSAVSDAGTPTVWRFEDFEALRWAGNSESGNVDGSITDARFGSITAIAMDARANIYVADAGNSSLRRIAPDGVVSTIAAGLPSFSGLAIDESRNIFAASDATHRIYKISPSGIVTTIAGAGEPEFLDGPGESARFNAPQGIALAPNGALLVADEQNHRIREIHFTPASSAAIAPALEVAFGNQLSITVKGTVGARYTIESANALDVGAQWNIEATTDNDAPLLLDRSAEIRFFRARQN